MNKRRIILRAITESIALARPFYVPRPGLRILMYHSIGQRAYNDEKGIFSITQQHFQSHIQSLAEIHDIQKVPLQPLNIPTSKLQVAITFDDGYLDNLKIAAPILIKHQIPFTVFACSDFIRNSVCGFMTPGDLKELSRLSGVTIGSHGKTHRKLTECDDIELGRELYDSKCYLEDLLGQPIISLSYPYGAANMRIRNAALHYGYNTGLSTYFNINAVGRDPLMLNRCNVERDDDNRVFHQKLSGCWDWFRWRSTDPVKLMSE
jgi:peptidoglycan/xylan/chitin deacetylase (PgdA/CDA1 family)